MESGCFGKFGKVENLKKKLEKFNQKHLHKASGNELIRAVQIDKVGKFRDQETLEGLIIEQIMGEVPEIHQEGDKYVIVLEHKPITLYSKFMMIGNGLIVLDNSRLQESTFRILSKAMAGTDDFVSYVVFDLQKIFTDFHGHWLAGVSGRKGHWRSGTLYGDSLEEDTVVGDPLAKSMKKIVGFHTTYFSSNRVKVAVTLGGSVTVWSGVKKDQFLGFVLDQLAPYMSTVPL